MSMLSLGYELRKFIPEALYELLARYIIWCRHDKQYSYHGYSRSTMAHSRVTSTLTSFRHQVVFDELLRKGLKFSLPGMFLSYDDFWYVTAPHECSGTTAMRYSPAKQQ